MTTVAKGWRRREKEVFIMRFLHNMFSDIKSLEGRL